MTNPSNDQIQPALKPGTGHRFILSAPSGTGKTTLCRRLRERFPEMRYSISYTTRSPRAGEQDGVDYHFISKHEFEDRLKRNLWAEWAQVHNNYYGTSAEFLEKTIAAGEDILLDIDVQGTVQILKRFPDSVTVFILPPSMDALKERLTERGTDSPEIIARRLHNAVGEIAQKDLYRHIIVNDVLEKAFNELVDLILRYRKEPAPFKEPTGAETDAR